MNWASCVNRQTKIASCQVDKVEIEIIIDQAFFAFALGFVYTLTLQSPENYKQAQSPPLWRGYQFYSHSLK